MMSSRTTEERENGEPAYLICRGAGSSDRLALFGAALAVMPLWRGLPVSHQADAPGPWTGGPAAARRQRRALRSRPNAVGRRQQRYVRGHPQPRSRRSDQLHDWQSGAGCPERELVLIRALGSCRRAPPEAPHGTAQGGAGGRRQKLRGRDRQTSRDVVGGRSRRWRRRRESRQTTCGRQSGGKSKQHPRAERHQPEEQKTERAGRQEERPDAARCYRRASRSAPGCHKHR